MKSTYERCSNLPFEHANVIIFEDHDSYVDHVHTGLFKGKPFRKFVPVFFED